MKIIIEKYNPVWVKEFKKLKKELASILKILKPTEKMLFLFFKSWTKTSILME